MKLDALRLAVLGTGGRQIELRWGYDTVTFSGSQTSADKQIAHGLGRAPVVVVATETTTYNGVIYAVRAFTATEFTVRGGCPFGSLTGLTGFSWIAIG